MPGSWAWLGVALWSFPQMALGLSGFEMIMTVVPRSAAAHGPTDNTPTRRVRNTRKLMVVAASIMAVYLVSAVAVTTLLVPHAELTPGGAAEHRALAYLAHGSPLADGKTAAAINPLFGHRFGDLFDLSTAFILCLAGASVTMGLQNLLPHYLNRLGMEVSWAGKVGVILHVLNVIVLLVTVVFRASPVVAAMGLRHQRARAAGRRRAGGRQGSGGKTPDAVSNANCQMTLACRRRGFLPGDDRPDRADQPLGPDDCDVLRRRRSWSARSSRAGSAAPNCGSRALISSTKPRGSAGRNCAVAAQRCSRRTARA